MDKSLIAMSFAIVSFVCGSLGYVAGMQHEQEPVVQANFGLLDGHAYEHFPECFSPQMTEHWSNRLMYLNGVWTAGCLNERYRQYHEEQEDET